MLRTIPWLQNREQQLAIRIGGIAIFTLLTIISAKISVELFFSPVPFTLQVLTVLLAGMVLGWRDGLLSQVAYVALVAANLPFDARGLGAAALFGPTGGYLVGFIAAAGVTGWLVEKAGTRVWQRWLAGVVGIAVIYFFGVTHLMAFTGMNFEKAWAAGAAPFWALDLVKAFLAAAATEIMRAFVLREQPKS